MWQNPTRTMPDISEQCDRDEQCDHVDLAFAHRIFLKAIAGPVMKSLASMHRAGESRRPDVRLRGFGGSAACALTQAKTKRVKMKRPSSSAASRLQCRVVFDFITVRDSVVIPLSNDGPQRCGPAADSPTQCPPPE